MTVASSGFCKAGERAPGPPFPVRVGRGEAGGGTVVVGGVGGGGGVLQLREPLGLAWTFSGGAQLPGEQHPRAACVSAGPQKLVAAGTGARRPSWVSGGCRPQVAAHRETGSREQSSQGARPAGPLACAGGRGLEVGVASYMCPPPLGLGEPSRNPHPKLSAVPRYKFPPAPQPPASAADDCPPTPIPRGSAWPPSHSSGERGSRRSSSRLPEAGAGAQRGVGAGLSDPGGSRRT